MPKTVRKGDKGPGVRKLQKILNEKGYPCGIDGDFGAQTKRALRAFQSQNLDQHGNPLLIDGIAGPIAWWSLTHPKPAIEPPSAVNFLRMPYSRIGGSSIGRAALKMAINEMKNDAREIGGNNRGPFVRKYLNELAPIGSSWCASFVSWCFSQGSGEMPFKYTVGARHMLGQFKRKGWTYGPGIDYEPKPGDIVVWWRERLAGWKGHVGLVHQVRDGMLYTVEGNKSSKVQGFSYVLSRMEKLLGYGHVPNR